MCFGYIPITNSKGPDGLVMQLTAANDIYMVEVLQLYTFKVLFLHQA